MRFQSFLSSIMENYVAYRNASGHTSTSYVKNIIRNGTADPIRIIWRNAISVNL